MKAVPAPPADTVVYADVKASSLTPHTVIVEGRIDPETGRLTGKLSFYRVLEFSEKGHEVHVKVQKLNEKGTLNWCYQSEARVFVQ